MVAKKKDAKEETNKEVAGQTETTQVPEVPEAKAEPVVVKKGEGLCEVCGEPVAPGQTSVCREHVRSN